MVAPNTERVSISEYYSQVLQSNALKSGSIWQRHLLDTILLAVTERNCRAGNAGIDPRIHTNLIAAFALATMEEATAGYSVPMIEGMRRIMAAAAKVLLEIDACESLYEFLEPVARRRLIQEGGPRHD